MVKATQLNRGLAVNVDGQIFVVVEYEHVAKGNKRSYVMVKMRNIVTGQLREERLRASDSVENVVVEKKQMEYLYSAGEHHYLMDMTSFEQVPVDDGIFGEAGKYLTPNTQVEVQIHEGRILVLTPPNTVELTVSQTPPAVKGATATAQTKPATLETGLVVTVPPFINIGDVIRVDTRSGQYIERAKS
jgi:elongation factor P